MQREDCIPWPHGRLSPDGYGYTSRAGGAKRRYAHVVACEKAHGPCPPGKEALHSCGYRPCVNPAHLRWGTRRENVEDARQHGTLATGEQNGQSKLTDRGLAFAMQASGVGMTNRAIADELGVNQSTISRALSGRTWRS